MQKLTRSQIMQAARFSVSNRCRYAHCSIKANSEAGGLVSYAPDIPSMFRRSASYVDRILKDAKPGELPIEQADRVELVLNIKTAKSLSIKVPSRCWCPRTGSSNKARAFARVAGILTDPKTYHRCTIKVIDSLRLPVGFQSLPTFCDMKSIHDIRRDNLRQLIDARFGGSQTRFAKEVGLQQPSFVSRLLTNREGARKNIGDRLMRRVETALGLSPNFLDTPSFELVRPLYVRDPRAGDLDLKLTTALTPESGPDQARAVLPKMENADRRVRLLSGEDLGQFATLASVYEAKAVTEMLTVHTEPAAPHAVGLRLTDDAMSERFPGGSIVVIADTRSPRANDFVVAVLPGVATAVMRQWIDVAGRQFLVPLNRAYQATEATPDCRVLGVVVEAMVFL